MLQEGFTFLISRKIGKFTKTTLKIITKTVGQVDVECE